MLSSRIISCTAVVVLILFVTVFSCSVLAKKKVRKSPLEKYDKFISRDFDTEERIWFARHHTRLQRIEQGKEKLPPTVLNTKPFSDPKYSTEICTDYDFRLFLSTNRQAWILLYDSQKIAKLQNNNIEKQMFETFKADWSRFAKTVTFSDVAAVVGAIDVSSSHGKQILALNPQLLKSDERTHDSIEGEFPEHAPTTGTGIMSSFFSIGGESASRSEPAKLLNEKLGIKIRYFARGGKFLKEEETENEEGDILTLESHVRSGVADYEAELRPSIVYNGPKTYQALRQAALDNFNSKVVSVPNENVKTMVDLEKLIDEKATIKRKAIVMITPSSSSSSPSSSSKNNFDGHEFAFHFISRQQCGRDVSDEYKYEYTKTAYENKMIFVLTTSESEIAKSLLEQVSSSSSSSSSNEQQQPLLIYYERAEQQDPETKEWSFAPSFSARLFTASPIDDFKNIARNLVTSVAPKTSTKNVVPVHECKTLKECFKSPHYNFPFVVRQAPEILAHPDNNNIDTVLHKLIELRKNNITEFVEGVDPVLGDVLFMGAAEATRRFLNNTLHGNIIDGPGLSWEKPSDRWWMPPKAMQEKAHDDNDVRLLDVLILSPENSYTHPHYDPPIQGSTFQHIFKGQKVFEFINPHKHAKVMECLPDEGVPPEESGAVCQVTARMAAEQGKVKHDEITIYQVFADPGDFVVWPPGWIHQIWSPKACLASNGFMHLVPEKKKKKTKTTTRI